MVKHTQKIIQILRLALKGLNLDFLYFVLVLIYTDNNFRDLKSLWQSIALLRKNFFSLILVSTVVISNTVTMQSLPPWYLKLLIYFSKIDILLQIS